MRCTSSRRSHAEIFFKNDTGERIVLDRAERGAFFGDVSLLDGGSRTASVVAKEDLTCLRLDRSDLETFLKTHPPAAMDLLAAMGRRLTPRSSSSVTPPRAT